MKLQNLHPASFARIRAGGLAGFEEIPGVNSQGQDPSRTCEESSLCPSREALAMNREEALTHAG